MRVISGQVTVASAGTEEAFSDTATHVAWIRIKPLDSNTGEVYIGNNGDGTVSSSTGYQLLAAGAQEDRGITLEAPVGGTLDLRDILIDVETNGEGVTWIALRKIGG